MSTQLSRFTIVALAPLALATACADPDGAQPLDAATARAVAGDDLGRFAAPSAATTTANRREGPAAPAPAQCDAVGRTVNVPLRISSSRGHVGGRNRAVYRHLLGGGWSLAENTRASTAGTCNAEDMRTHAAEVTVPVNIKCVPHQPLAGGPADTTKPCQPEITFGDPTFGAGGPSNFKQSEFTGTYFLGMRRTRITDGLGTGGYEDIPDYISRTSSCFYHEGSTYTGAHWCMTKAESVRSVAPFGPLDIDRGTRHFTVGLGAVFVHALHNPSQWNVMFGGGWTGLSYGPVSVGAQWNVTPPERDESSGWNGWNYTVQCGVDGKPYLIDRTTVNATSNATNLSFAGNAEQAAIERRCDDVVARVDRLIADFAGHADLLAELLLLRNRARTRDVDCAAANDQVSALVRNKDMRARIATLRARYTLEPNTAGVLAALAAFDAWLRSAEGRFAPEPAFGTMWRAVETAIANLDLITTLLGLQTLYPAGELPAFDAAVADLLVYLRGPGPLDQTQVAAKYRAVQDRLAELLRNRLCRTRAVAALDGDQRRMLDNVEHREPYAARIRELITAARAALGVRTLTCAQVTTATEALQQALQRVFVHMRGEKLVAAVKTLNGPGCQVTGRAAFGRACDALIDRLRAMEFADRAAIDAAYAALLVTKRQLCEPAAPPVEQSLPPVQVPVPTVPDLEPTSDDDAPATLEALDDERAEDLQAALEAETAALDDVTLDALIAVDDLGPVDDADVVLATALAADDPAWQDGDASWFGGAWLVAEVAAEVTRAAILGEAGDAEGEVGAIPGEICDLHHEEPTWPTDDACIGCLTCDASGCALSAGEPTTCTAESPASSTEAPLAEPTSTEAPLAGG